MPIRPENRGRHPKDWSAISREVRERAGNQCEGISARARDAMNTLELFT